MKRYLVLFFGCLCAFQAAPPADSRRQQKAIELYTAAERLYNLPDPTPATDSSALAFYEQAAGELAQTGGADSLVFDAWLKSGTLLQGMEKQAAAITAYARSIRVLKSGDKRSFRPLLFTGNAYYLLSRYDSAVYYFEWAEQVAGQANGQVEEIERLYNSFGVICYESGNYKQAVNYFEKAIAVTTRLQPDNTEALAGFRSNLASCYRKLGNNDKALQLYNQLLAAGINSDEIGQNAASIYLSQGDHARAIQQLRKINPAPGAALRIQVYEKLGRAYLLAGKTDSAARYLHLAKTLNQQLTADDHNVDAGILHKDNGDLYIRSADYNAALASYQQAIISLSGNFTAKDIYQNPADFTGSFASFYLFDALESKATAFVQYYQQMQNPALLKAALETYQSAYSLSRYILRSYDSDEARLFLSQRVYPAFEQGVRIALQLHRLTAEKQYQLLAFEFTERSKATVLAAGLRELEIKQIPGIADSLISKEKNLKYNISRMLAQLEHAADSTQREGLHAQLRDLEIQLSRVQDKFNDHPGYYRLKFSDSYSPADSIRSQLLDPKTAIISYFSTSDSLVAFVITHTDVNSVQLPYSATLRGDIAAFRAGLHSTTAAAPAAQKLYTQLFAPLTPYLRGKQKLIIIPDGELHFIPFEALQTNDDSPNYLLEDFAVSYNYSCNFLHSLIKKRKPGKYNVLGFAPYSIQAAGANTVAVDLPPLPSSAGEITNISKDARSAYIGMGATKKAFLETAGQFDIIHLATHAEMDDADPLHSYIAFYPAANTTYDHKLYTHELYNLQLNSAQLAILSACETGAGRLIKGEGVMSLARGFAYAGCPSIITSLWKADDKATALIAGKLHAYLAKGYDKDEALRQAKLDYLQQEKDARFTVPAYWAHFVLIGDAGPVTTTSRWLTYLLIALALAATAGLLYVLRRRLSQQ